MAEDYDLRFPLAGIDRSMPLVDQKPMTTRIGQNVRTTDTILMRARGGSRPGMTKYPNDQVPAGSELIQHLTQVTVYDPAFTLAAFEDFDPDNVKDDANYPDYFYPPTGNGFTPSQGLPAPPRRRVTVTVSTPTQTNGQNATVTAVLSIYTGGALIDGQTVMLRTNPPGLDGDRTTAVTDANGVAVFTVNEASYIGPIRYTVQNTYTPPP